jgi:chromosome segregation ATPase
MVSLEQVRALEARVEKVVSYIATLREENAELGRRVGEADAFIDSAAAELEAAEQARDAAVKRAAAAEARIEELQALVARASERAAAAESKAAALASSAEEYRMDQVRIEEGIIHALEKLDSFEDLLLSQAAPEAPSQAEAPRPAELAAREEGIEVKVAPAPVEELDAEPETEPAAAAEGEAEPVPAENELDIF